MFSFVMSRLCSRSVFVYASTMIAVSSQVGSAIVVRVENVTALTDEEILQNEHRNEVVQKKVPERQAIVATDFIHDHLPIFS